MKLPERKLAEKILIQFSEAYNKRDLAQLLTLFTENTNMWGTARDEYRSGLNQIEDQFKRDWSQAEKSEIIIISFVPSAENDFWAAAICDAKISMQEDEYTFQHLRITITLANENKAHKISHMHASFPDVRNPENSSFPTR